MSKKGSKIASYIDSDYKKEKEWKEKAKRIKTLQENRKNNILILGENSRNPIIIEEKR